MSELQRQHEEHKGRLLRLFGPVKHAREEIICDDPRPHCRHIGRVVAAFYGVTLDDIMSMRRTADVVHPRHVTFYLCKVMTLRSLPYIGSKLGDKDHTTILHGFRRIEKRIAENPMLAAQVEALKAQITASMVRA